MRLLISNKTEYLFWQSSRDHAQTKTKSSGKFSNVATSFGIRVEMV
jgi:hypothetical protein